MKSPCNAFSISLTLFLLFLSPTQAISQSGAHSFPSGFAGHAGQASQRPASGATTSTNSNVISTSMTGFGIPYNIGNQDGRYIEVQLYVSRDQGKTWQFDQRRSPDEREFPFSAKSEGEYWFALKTLDRDRKMHPTGDPAPELKVRVDTQKPQLDFAVKSDNAGRLVCKWRAEDGSLNTKSLNISYQKVGDPSGHWKTIDYRNIQQRTLGNVFADQLAWWPDASAREVLVRLKIADAAGNESVETRRVLVPRTAARTQQNATAFRKPQPPAATHNQQPDQQVAMHCENGICRPVNPVQGLLASARKRLPRTAPRPGSKAEYVAPPVPPGFLPKRDMITVAATSEVSLDPISNAAQPEAAPDTIAWNTKPQTPLNAQRQSVSSSTSAQFRPIEPRNNSAAGKANTGIANFPTTNNRFAHTGHGEFVPIERPRAAQHTQTPSNPFTQKQLNQHAQQANSGFQQVPSSPASVRRDISEPPPRSPEVVKRPARKRNSPHQSINSRRFLLDYNVDAIDPSGVGKVILWVTRDEGETWKSMAQDNDNESPFPVQVDEDGAFGFRVVIHSKDGNAGRPPNRGDEADMWIDIDTVAPTAQIVSVPYGTGNEAGKLIINWKASDDESLRTKPIDLFYSSQPEGPWTIIEQGLRNTGRYTWKVKRDMPERIFLKMIVYDGSGNITVQQLTQPIDVSGLVPRGRINGVQAIRTQ